MSQAKRTTEKREPSKEELQQLVAHQKQVIQRLSSRIGVVEAELAHYQTNNDALQNKLGQMMEQENKKEKPAK